MHVEKHHFLPIYRGVKSVWALECNSYQDPLTYCFRGYFNEVAPLVKNGDILFAFGKDDTRIYVLHKHGEDVVPSNTLHFQSIDKEIKGKKNVRPKQPCY